MKCVTSWKRGQAILVNNWHLWALWHCVDPPHTACMEQVSCVFTRSYGHQKWPKKAEMIMYVLTQGVWLFPQLLFCTFTKTKFSSKYRNQSLICSFYLSMHRNRKQILKCFSIVWEDYFNIQIFFMSRTQLWPFWFWISRYKELMRPN